MSTPSEEVELSVTSAALVKVTMYKGVCLVHIYMRAAPTTENISKLTEVMVRWLEHNRTAVLISRAPCCKESLLPDVPALLNLGARLLEHRDIVGTHVCAVCVLTDCSVGESAQAEQLFRTACHPTFDLLVTPNEDEARAFLDPVLTCS